MKRGKLTLVLMAAALFLGQIAFADVGQVLPKFSFKDAEGKTVTQENLKGKKTLLVFSQMACRQCRYEVKELMSKKDQIANMYVILVDMNPEAAGEAWKTAGFDLPVLFDPDFALGEAVGFRSTPSSIVVDKELKITVQKVGYAAGDVEEYIKALQ